MAGHRTYHVNMIKSKWEIIWTKSDLDLDSITPPKRVTAPSWGPPPPCKQAALIIDVSLVPLFCLLAFSLDKCCKKRELIESGHTFGFSAVSTLFNSLRFWFVSEQGDPCQPLQNISKRVNFVSGTCRMSSYSLKYGLFVAFLLVTYLVMCHCQLPYPSKLNACH